ncbi:helix-turn-helix domain-containing protein [Laribacter hongkongensis]|uniref:Helix-turn-helix domain-containing protein n=2 Tax=Laribacter hongkongensis TaxID=168471 RepID=C1D8C9_LARHH|nr:helix-turn-helix domain-containing protein [Laribacter hongkongensis]ACO74719.1 hypothetical protein LHK_01734 [Laribacter hongkongensis HLHK9]MCG8991734.1 helix-turn-helix domain-containing protein [Laribacter hongkongensis]MCG8998929.1 helix-turn-helix domain-containing protein [Laribacter hongkongensis]MCG9000288.1 helix-turn-helix domain-containing protein [Laribacter hongkongensis]MCG9004833.1 helix-turn-helix domain-containing protein [Laribacter hongkongensis]
MAQIVCFLRQQAAEYLGLSENTLAQFASQGGGPVYFRVGRRVMYRQQDLDAWLASRRPTGCRSKPSASKGVA